MRRLSALDYRNILSKKGRETVPLMLEKGTIHRPARKGEGEDSMIIIECEKGHDIIGSYSEQIQRESHIKGTYLCRCRLQFRPREPCLEHSGLCGQKSRSCSDCKYLIMKPQPKAPPGKGSPSEGV